MKVLSKRGHQKMAIHKNVCFFKSKSNFVFQLTISCMKFLFP